MKHRVLMLAVMVLVTGIHSCQQSGRVFWPAEKSPEIIGQRITGELLSRNTFMMYETGSVTALHYAEACAAFGAARLAAFTGDSVSLRLLAERYRKVIDDSIPNTANHVDANVYGILPMELFKHTGDKRFYEQGFELAEGQWSDTLVNGMTSQIRYWIDDIWMIGSLQVQAYRVSGKKIYLDRAAETIASYLERLQQQNGLFHHGEDTPFFWGRGNGWVAAGGSSGISTDPCRF